MRLGWIGVRRKSTNPRAQFRTSPLSKCQTSLFDPSFAQGHGGARQLTSRRQRSLRWSCGSARFNRLRIAEEPALWCTKTKVTWSTAVVLLAWRACIVRADMSAQPPRARTVVRGRVALRPARCALRRVPPRSVAVRARAACVRSNTLAKETFHLFHKIFIERKRNFCRSHRS